MRAYDGSVNQWEDYSRYVNPEEMASTGIYGDLYHHGYVYAPYGAYAPPGTTVPTMGQDGQLFGHQHYQYPGPYYQPTTPTNSAFTPTQWSQPPTSQAAVPTSVTVDQTTASVDVTKAHSNVVSNVTPKSKTMAVPLRPKPQNLSVTSNELYGRGALPGLQSAYTDPRYSYDGMHSPIPWFDCSSFPDGQRRLATTSSVSSMVSHVGHNLSSRNQNLQPLPPPYALGLHVPRPTSGMRSATPRYINGTYPSSKVYGQCGNAYRTGPGFASNGYDFRRNGRGWLASGKSNEFFSNGNENIDDLCELKKGPRSGCFKSPNVLGPNVKIAVKGQNLQAIVNSEESCSVPDRGLFNKADFCETYSDAKFFVIKSFSEDDVHKSIKYNVWASTQNGNKKLDAAYQDSKKKDGGCPVFLFFSVNTSGQFVGVAEMVGPVDFNKTVNYWQQDRWNGCFPVKWHIIRDVPNSMLRHITLQNNENKPVTNSRDTQEVNLEQGLQMLKLFKEYVSETSLLDDFLFYELRQKSMQEKRGKQQQPQKQASFMACNGKSADILPIHEKDKDVVKERLKLEKPLEMASAMHKEAALCATGEGRPSENGVAITAGETPKIAKSETEKRVISNGVLKG